MTHIGIVDAGAADGAVVIEVTDVVRETPIREFLARGKGVAVYRLDALSDEQRMAVVAAARRQLGKPSDFFLRRSWDAFLLERVGEARLWRHRLRSWADAKAFDCGVRFDHGEVGVRPSLG